MLVEELRRLAPEFRIAGGSFAHWLPHPRDVAPAERLALRLAAERDATGQCLTALVATVGQAGVEPPRLHSGARQWPTGYTGSVSHKGTTIMAGIAPTDRVTSVGIDLERRDAKDLPALRGLDAAERPPAVSEVDGRVVVFSLKEAAFKALHPILGRPPGFADIGVSWLPSAHPRPRGVARACGVALDVRCSLAVPSWVVSTALWPAAMPARGSAPLR